MSVDNTQPSTSQRQKRLNGIYWKTFVGFVKKDGEKNTEESANGDTDTRVKSNQIHRRERSFEYMELTAKDTILTQSESDSCSSPEILITVPCNNEASMYAVLDLSKKKEIQISDEIAIFEGSPIRRRSFTLDVTSIPNSPKCSPVLNANDVLPTDVMAPSPIPGKYQRAATLTGIDKDEAIFEDTENGLYSNIDDLSYTDSDESEASDRFDTYSPSMEPAPWKDQCISIQRWMVPHVIPDNDDDIIIPDVPPVPDCEYSHYVPTLEAIQEESDEWVDAHTSPKLKTYKSASTSEYQNGNENQPGVSWNSTNDLSSSNGQSQDDLFSMTSTCGSIGSIKRMGTFENLSFDEEAVVDTDGSGDELNFTYDVVTVCDDVALNLDVTTSNDLDSVQNKENNINDVAINNNNNDVIICGVDKAMEDCQIMSAKEYRNQSSPPESTKFVPQDIDEKTPPKFTEVSPETKTIDVTQVLSKDVLRNKNNTRVREINSNSDGLKYTRTHIADSSHDSEIREFTTEKTTLVSEPQNFPIGNVVDELAENIVLDEPQEIDVANRHEPRDSGVDEVIITSASSRTSLDDESPMGSEINIPGLPKEIYFDSRDIPKIVVMFAKEELAKERERSIRSTNSEASEEAGTLQYRKRSSTYDPESFTDSAYSSRDGVQRRISQIRTNDASRLSTLSSSTPELSIMAEDALPYIPVSYASEAAARRKNKRRATMSAAEANKNKKTAARVLQTKTLISGSSFGSGFGSLRKKLKSRKRVGNGLRRSQSEKPQISRESPDLSGPMSRFLNSPRRRRSNKDKTGHEPKIEGRRRGIRSVFSGLIRRISLRFTSRNPTPEEEEDKNDNSVIEQEALVRNSLGHITEESNTSGSFSRYSSARESMTTRNTNSRGTEMSPQRLKSASDPPSAHDIDDFRHRSYSVPIRPRKFKSSRTKFPSMESDVFESAQTINDDNSLDKTIYV